MKLRATQRRYKEDIKKILRRYKEETPGSEPMAQNQFDTPGSEPVFQNLLFEKQLA